MECRKCNNNIEIFDKFCPNCGYPVKIVKVGRTALKNDDELISEIEIKSNKQKKLVSMMGFLFSFLGITLFAISGFILYGSELTENVYISKTTLKERSSVRDNSMYYSTIINYDKKYELVSVSSLEEALEKIKKESDLEKKKCYSKETITVLENKLSSDFEIVGVNLCELNEDIANDIYEVFDKVGETFPEVKGYLTNLTLMNTEYKEEFIAAFMPFFHFANSKSIISLFPWIIKSQMLLNSGYYLDIDNMNEEVKEASNIGYFIPNATGVSLIAHELGHYLSFVALLKNYGLETITYVTSKEEDTVYEVVEAYTTGTFSYDMIAEAYQLYIDNGGTSYSDEYMFRSSISQYAVAIDENGYDIYDETIAEAFHDTYVNGDKAKIASKLIVQVLKNRLEK